MKKYIIIGVIILAGIMGGYSYYEKSINTTQQEETAKDNTATPVVKEDLEKDTFTEYENNIYKNIKSMSKAKATDMVITDGNTIHIQLVGDKAEIMSNMGEIKSYIKKNKDSKYVRYEILISTDGAILDRFDV